MKLLLVCSMALLTGLTAQANTDEKVKTTEPEALYLHVFRQTTGQRVVVDPEAAKDAKPSTPPTRLVTIKVETGRAFEVICSSMHRVSGRLDRKEAQFVATLEGACGSGFKYSGPVKLDEVIDPDVTWFSGAVFRCRCVFSRNKDITPFLTAQAGTDAEKLREATELTRRNNALRRNHEAEQGGDDQSPASSGGDD